MKKELIVHLHASFEDAAHHEDGVEFWYARDLQLLLGYTTWRRFEGTIERAKTACSNAGQHVEDHFADAGKMVGIGSRTSRVINDLALDRYACYLIAQNGDPRKDEIAFAMNYFAVQTRKQELIEQPIAELERLQAREKLTLSQRALSGVMYERGVDSQGFARILSKGDAALFGGKTTQDMKTSLGVPGGRPLADFLPTLTINAKDFANEVTNTQVKDQELRGEADISREHVQKQSGCPQDPDRPQHPPRILAADRRSEEGRTPLEVGRKKVADAGAIPRAKSKKTVVAQGIGWLRAASEGFIEIKARGLMPASPRYAPCQ